MFYMQGYLCLFLCCQDAPLCSAHDYAPVSYENMGNNISYRISSVVVIAMTGVGRGICLSGQK